MLTDTGVIETLDEKGFFVKNEIFSAEEADVIADHISLAVADRPAFRKAESLFAIRRFFKELPGVRSLIFTTRLRNLILEHFGEEYFVVKAIYFDKPAASNWFVAWHQDLTISVTEKLDIPGFGPWTVKPGQFAVQPPVEILEHNFTIRIHLDDTDENNGALKVIPGSHLKDIILPETIKETAREAVSCTVQKGGIMLMRPLLLHASGRTTNEKRRRVIHIEFSKTALPVPLQWAELMSL